MSELRKLVDEETDELLLSVLRSAEDDMPGQVERARNFAALGIGAPIAATAKAGGLFGATFGKWIFHLSLVVFGAALGGGGVLLASKTTAPAAVTEPQTLSPTSVVPAATATATTVSETTPTATATALVVARPEPPAEALPLAPEAPKGSAPSVGASSTLTKPVAAASLGAELAALDEARTALASGDASAALSRLDRHDHDFPNAVLAQEAMMLRIEALNAKGDTKTARSLANRFLATHPSTTYEDRVRTLLGGTEAR